MRSLRTTTRLVALLTAPALLVAMTGHGASAEARRTSSITIASVINPAYPQEVTLNAFSDPSDDTGEWVSFRVTASPSASDVVVTPSGAGLAFHPATRTIASLDGGEYASFEVDASSTGFHSMSVTVTATGLASQTVTLPHMWAAGGPHITGGGTLAGKTYAWQGYDTEYGSSYTTNQVLTFVDGSYVYDGLPAFGPPSCTQVSTTCQRYYYDPATGLVQIGDDVIAQVVGTRLYTDNLAPSDPSDTAEFFQGAMFDPLAFATKHLHLAHTWSYTSKWSFDDFSRQKLTLHGNGTYALSWVGGHPLHGTYQVHAGGRIVFFGAGKTKKKVVQEGTLLLRTDASGAPAPGTLGVFLVQSGKKGKSPAGGNLLLPTKK